MAPRRSGPGGGGSSPYGSRSVGDRNWSDLNGRYQGGDRYGQGGDRYGRGDRWDDNRYNHGRYDNHRHHHHHGHHHYPYYRRYGYYRPYYYRPYYDYYYPYFVPTFSFGLGYWGAPAYYESYYASPSVVYTEPATVVQTAPLYDDTAYYSDTPAYVDSGTTYVQTTPTVESQNTYVERQYTAPAQPSQPPTSSLTPTPQPTADSQTAPAPTQQQAPPKEPDPRVLASVGQGNEHFGAGRFGDARRSYGEAVAIDATDGVAKLLYGLASFAEADYAIAASSIRQALDATPDLIWYPFNVKALYRNDSRFQEHVAGLARFVDSQLSNTDAQFLLGYMWYASGDAVSAKTIFGAISTNNPSDELFMALRDASAQALEATSAPPARQQVESDTAKVPVVPTP